MENERRIEGGKLVLFTRSGTWYCRIYIGDRKYLIRTLKTSKYEEAESKARRIYYQTEIKLEEGLPIHSRPFTDVIDEYVSMRQEDHDRGGDTQAGMLRQIKRVVKFWKEYAGTKAVEKIDDKMLRDFVPWRRDYYIRNKDKNGKLNPTDKTIAFDVMIGKALIKWAHEQGYRGKAPLPTFAFTPKNNRVRPHFNSNEVKRIRTGLQAWIDETKNNYWKISRTLLRDYVLTLLFSGIRVGEANHLLVRDIEYLTNVEGESLQFAVRGKTGMRAVHPHVDLMPFLKERILGKKPNDLVFTMPEGNEIKTLALQFNSFLKSINLMHSSDGAKYSLYCLRHTYAVRTLGRVDIFSVAQNMGTSVEMIQHYYGAHGIPSDRARKLSGDGGDYQLVESPRLTVIKDVKDHQIHNEEE